jgi:hypothetical protein
LPGADCVPQPNCDSTLSNAPSGKRRRRRDDNENQGCISELKIPRNRNSGRIRPGQNTRIIRNSTNPICNRDQNAILSVENVLVDLTSCENEENLDDSIIICTDRTSGQKTSANDTVPVTVTAASRSEHAHNQILILLSLICFLQNLI